MMHAITFDTLSTRVADTPGQAFGTRIGGAAMSPPASSAAGRPGFTGGFMDKPRSPFDVMCSELHRYAMSLGSGWHSLDWKPIELGHPVHAAVCDVEKLFDGALPVGANGDWGTILGLSRCGRPLKPIEAIEGRKALQALMSWAAHLASLKSSAPAMSNHEAAYIARQAKLRNAVDDARQKQPELSPQAIYEIVASRLQCSPRTVRRADQSRLDKS